jgi:pimeloyl-ACP methyl ester carboxylesterase
MSAVETGTLARRPIGKEGGERLAYRRLPPDKKGGRAPGFVFLHGFRSDMTGSKAQAVESFCRARGHACLLFDGFGHGQSSGDFALGSIGRWRDDAAAALDSLTDGPQILVGSSFGGWIMTLAALARPDRVAALVGIAAAPDFTEDLILPAFSPAARAALEAKGQVLVPGTYGLAPYPITKHLIEEARAHLVLRGPIPFAGPVRLIHGLEDPDVPWRTSLALAERLASTDIDITLVKGGGHRLSEPADLARLTAILDALLGALQH